MLTLNDGRSELWQWDTGRTLAVDADCSQVHFSNKVFGRSIDVDVVNGAAIIPDILLQTDKDLNVWAFAGTAENGYTKISKTFTVNRRNKPADYVFTPQEQIALKDATAILEEAKDISNKAIESAEQAEDIANKAVEIADEMKRLADQVGQNAEAATKAKADALTAQTKAEEARNAAEIAKKAAEDAANNAGVDASAASSAANRAESAASDAMNVLADIQSLYQTMQEYASQAIQNVQTEGDTQVQRVADEGTAQTAAAKEQADRAQAEADRAEAARAKAEEVVESCIPDDTAVDGKPWTSKSISDRLCMPFEESGNPVQVYPVENYPLGVKVSWEPVQEGEGDPSQENIRPITGRDSVMITHSNGVVSNDYDISLPETVYGGEVDAVTGESNRTWRTITLTGEEDSHIFENLFYLDLYKDVSFVAEEAANRITGQSSHYRYYLYADDCIGVTLDGRSVVYNSNGKYPISDEGLQEWKAYLAAQYAAGTPVQVCYKLAEPVPFIATGTQPILALSGVNTIYTDADGVIVTGAEDPKHTITELKNAILSLGGNV